MGVDCKSWKGLGTKIFSVFNEAFFELQYSDGKIWRTDRKDKVQWNIWKESLKKEMSGVGREEERKYGGRMNEEKD